MSNKQYKEERKEEQTNQDYYDTMFRRLRPIVNFQGEEDWELFKKWVITNPHSSWELQSGRRLWNTWWNIQESKENEKMRKIEESSRNRKECLCKICGKKKAASQFESFEHETIQGLRSCVNVRTGIGICKNCFEEDKAKRKLASEEHRKELRAKWYQDHKVEISAKQRERRHSNSESDKKRKAAHRDQINQHLRERKQTDPLFKLKCQARTAIYQSFARTGNVKQERCENITGLTINDLADYLCGTYEQTYGEKWDGVKAIHIDHIVPLATAKNEQDVKRLCHYSNLRLLTAEDNLKKGAKINFAV